MATPCKSSGFSTCADTAVSSSATLGRTLEKNSGDQSNDSHPSGSFSGHTVKEFNRATSLICEEQRHSSSPESIASTITYQSCSPVTISHVSTEQDDSDNDAHLSGVESMSPKTDTAGLNKTGTLPAKCQKPTETVKPLSSDESLSEPEAKRQKLEKPAAASLSQMEDAGYFEIPHDPTFPGPTVRMPLSLIKIFGAGFQKKH